MPLPELDMKITIGNIITLILLLVSIIFAWSQIQAEVRELRIKQDEIRSNYVKKDVVEIKFSQLQEDIAEIKQLLKELSK